MRKTLSVVTAVALIAMLLSACAPGENEEAVAAAEEYSTELEAWSDEVSAAVVRRSETDTADLAQVLDDVPTLVEIDGAENTADYVAAEQASAHVDRIVTELHGYATVDAMEPISDEVEATSQLTERIDQAFTDRFDNASRAAVLDGDDESIHGLLAAYGAYAEAMIAAYEEESTLVESVVPDTQDGLSGSLRGFMLDLLDRRIAFQERTVENTRSWSQFADGYDDFYDIDPDTAWTLMASYMAVGIDTGYAEQLTVVTDALAKAISGDTADNMVLPAIGDPYRTAIIDGIVPPEVTDVRENTMARLWMLWRIRELENTPDAAYNEALAALNEEFIVHVETDVPTAKDYRVGSSRVLNAVAAHTRVATSGYDLDDDWLTALDEVREYEDSLRQMPMTSALGAAFDDLLVRQDVLHEDIGAAVDENGSDAASDVARLVDEYLTDAEKIVLPAVREIDQPETFEKLRVDAIEATAPTNS